MAENHLLSLIFAFCLISLCRADLFGEFMSDKTPCTEMCSNTYSPHTYEKTFQMSCCQRGCRLYSILEFMGDPDGNSTKDLCTKACNEAYDEKDELEACHTGCSSQKPFSDKLKQQVDDFEKESECHFLYPVMYVHSIYSNMFDKVKDHMTVQWSFYMQQDNGDLVVVQSGPLDMEEGQFIQTDPSNTPFSFESNLLPMDKSATPNSKHTQLRSLPEDGIPNYNFAVDSNNFQSSDWLSCISGKTGLPRLILTGIVLVSAWVMIWLCLTAANTAPDHHVKAEKLSINGDLEYLKEVELEKLMASLYPQDKAETSLLPLKITVQRV